MIDFGTQLKRLYTTEVPFKGKPEIHVSDVRTYLQCRRKWQYVSPLHQYLEPTASYPPFVVGRAIHYALEAYYDSGQTIRLADAAFNWFSAEIKAKHQHMMEAEREQMAENLELTIEMLRHYNLWVQRYLHAGKWSDQYLDFIAMETEFKTSMRNSRGHYARNWFFAGRFDGIVRHKQTGEHWIWETKTSRSTGELANSLWNDNQVNAYMIAAQNLFKVPIVGVLYNVMRKKIPTHPKRLQSGLFSVAKNQDVSYDSYLATILKEDPRPEDVSEEDYRKAITTHYGTFLDYLLEQENQSKWFMRVPIRRTPEQLRLAENDLYNIATEMVNPDIAIYPSPSWISCKWCMFKEPCGRLDRGESDQIIIQNEFRPRRQWDPMSGKEEENDN